MCPYCDGPVETSTDATRPRRPDHDLVECVECSGYAVRVASVVAPLADRTDPDADAVNRIVDA